MEDPGNIKFPIAQIQYFFDEDLLEHIVLQSNLYAVQKKPTKPLQLTRSGLEQFIGCCLFMSTFNLPRSRMFGERRPELKLLPTLCRGNAGSR